jgi:hypothetical protein
MNNKNFYRFLLFALLGIISSATSKADTYSYSISAKTWTAFGTVSLADVNWTAEGTTATFFGYSSSKGQQFGNGTIAEPSLKIHTSGIFGTVSSVKVNSSGGTDVAATISVSVGNTAFQCNGAANAAITATATDYTFTGSGSGAISINWNQTSVKALYIKSIEVVYTPWVCTESGLAFNESATRKLISDGAFTKAAASLNQTTPITYSSSNTAVASVNSATGEVTPVGTGTTTITATQLPDIHNEIFYCKSTVSYVLNLFNNYPTVSLTEINIPTIETYVDESSEETVLVGGANLSENISLSIGGSGAAAFSLSKNTVSQTNGSSPTETITVYYHPDTDGDHQATLSFTSNGATGIIRSLSGKATYKPLDTPVATDASAISSTTFTANWNTVERATGYEVSVKTMEAKKTNDLFFSEYAEGSSSNKYIEIFNGTGSDVDLSAYAIKISYNGAGWPITADSPDYRPLTGTITNNDTYLIAHNSASATVKAAADLLLSYNSSVQGSRIMSFSGNDALGLFKNDVLIDIIGTPESDATIDAAGTTNAGADHTLIRKQTVFQGNTSWTSSAGSNTEDSEWIVNVKDYNTNAGLHTYNSGEELAAIQGSPFMAGITNNIVVSDLKANTTYYYTVVAKNQNVLSPLSNQISVTTSPNTDISNVHSELKVYKVNDELIIVAEAGQLVEIYNPIGQKLMDYRTTQTVSRLKVNYKGVAIVKVGNDITKTIL